tara:strand:- start:2594 stop:3004 length:411 start_codon:yes stop_codon:yes gene_type:complete
MQMKNIFANIEIAIVLIAMFFATQTYGQEPKEIPNGTDIGVVKLPTFIDCGTSEAIEKVMESYKTELPFATYNSVIMIPPGNMLQGKTTLYIDPKTGSWSEIFELPTASGPNPFGLEKCIIGFGTGFKPFVEQSKT